MSPRIKRIFVGKTKAMLHLIKKLCLSLTRFSTLISYRRSFNVLSMDVCILFSYFFCSLILVSKKRKIEPMLTLAYQYNWQKFNNKMNEKRGQEYQNMYPEYVTEQINSCILELLLKRFRRMIFTPS